MVMATIGSLLYKRLESLRKFSEHPTCGNVSIDSSYLECIGILDIGRINQLLRMNLRSGKVFAHNGVVEHIHSHHGLVFSMHQDSISRFIERPFYVGRNPRESESIELYDKHNQVLTAIKRDPTRGYLFLASMYVLEDWETKIHDRLQCRRVRKFT